MRYVLGFDGGGTKTECVLMDETGAILARSRSGASNAVNVGAEASAAALAEAGQEALGSAAKSPFDVACLLAGISGAGEPSVRAEIQAHLKVVFPTATLVVTSDLVLSLAATAEIPSVVVIAGTGSAVLRSEEHTSELQSRLHLVCRLLLENKNNTPRRHVSQHD